MSWFQKLKDWWKVNILHHGEPDDISDRTGKSESDMKPGVISEDDWQNYIRSNQSSTWRKIIDSHDGRIVYKDGESPFRTNTAKTMMSLAALLFGHSFFDFSNIGDSQTASSSSRGSGWSDFLNRIFGSGQSANSGGSSILDSILGFGSQYASSLLNYSNMEKLIDKQNAYNTPANQMKRFEEAGLNPNLVYGLGSNGNQPSSGSVAPVDFDTSQREARMARMQIDTTRAVAQSQIAQAQADINLKNKSADEAEERRIAQSLQNSTYRATWFSEQMNRIAQYQKVINEIKNDNIRVDIEKDLKDAQKALFQFQSQPEYMQKLGSAEDAFSFVEGLLEKLSLRINEYFSGDRDGTVKPGN